jgi:hypothetical protein
MRSILRSVCLVFSIAALGGATAAELGWRFPTDKITLEQWQEFQAEVLAKPGIERQEAANQLVLTSSKERAIYVFTQRQHPAHPAVVVRAIVTHDGVTSLKRMGHYGGDRGAFDNWWREFEALDAGAANQIRK